jgi:hypothetical protein
MSESSTMRGSYVDDQIDITQDAATESSQEPTPESDAATESNEAPASNIPDELSVEANPSGPGDTISAAPPEDSGEPETKKAEAVADPEWRKNLKEFHDKVNGVLAAKENMKVVAMDQKIHSAYSQNWKIQCNRYFQLTVAMRRRLNNGTVGGKRVV